MITETTIKSFFMSIWGSPQDLKDYIESSSFDGMSVKWTGHNLQVFTREDYPDGSDYDKIDDIELTGGKPGSSMFHMSLISENEFSFSLYFTDGGFKKNKYYHIDEYMLNDN